MKFNSFYLFVSLNLLFRRVDAEFNQAFATSVVSDIENLIAEPWNRVLNIAAATFNSGGSYLYENNEQQVPTHVNYTQEFIWSLWFPVVELLDWVYVGFYDGSFFAYAGGSYIFQENRNNTLYSYDNATSRSNGKIVGPPSSTSDTYDCTVRPWYTISEEGGSVWTDPYIFVLGGSGVGITAALRVYNKHEEFLGIFAADYLLSNLDLVLATKVSQVKSNFYLIYIIDDKGLMISASVDGVSSDGNSRVRANESSHEIISSCSLAIDKEFNGNWTSAGSVLLTVDIPDDGIYYVQSNELTDEHGLHWHVVVVEQVNCDAGFYILNKEQVFDEDETRIVCVPCPDGAECLGGDLLPFPKSGSWSDVLETELVKRTFHTCSTQNCNGFRNNMKKHEISSDSNDFLNNGLDICFRVNRDDNDENVTRFCDIDYLQCEKGSTGPMCGSCKDDYRYESLERVCIKCDANPIISFIFLFVITGVGIVLCILKYYKLIEIPKCIWDSWFVMIGRHLFKTGSMKVLISTYQIIQSVTFSLDVKYPKIFSVSLKVLDFLSFDFPGMECNGVGVYDRVYVASIMPMILAVIIVMIGEIRIIITRKNRNNILEPFMIKKKCNLIKSQHAWSLLFLSYLVLPPITGKQFTALDCFPIKSSNLRVLRSDTLVNCDSKAHEVFEVFNSLLIIIYLSIPLIWIALLRREKQHLFPIGIEGDALIIQRRKMEDSLLQLKFLFERYRPNMVYFESADMFRRILFVGVIPLMATSSLIRSAIGVGFSLFSMIANREFSPYNDPDTNTIAYIADIVIYLTFASALMIETGLNERVNNFLFGVILIIVNFSVITVAMLGAVFRTKLDRDVKHDQRLKMVTKVTEAFHYSAVKFEEIFAHISETESLTSHSLFFTFGSLEEITAILHHGIPAMKSAKGIIFTVLHPLDMTAVEKRYFTSTDCFIVCSLPQRLLKPLPGYNHPRSTMWLLPHGALRACHSMYFGDLPDQLPWEEGKLLLPPHCIKKAYQIAKTDPMENGDTALTTLNASSLVDMTCGCGKSSKKVMPSSLVVEETMGTVMDIDNESFIKSLEFPLPDTTITKYLELMDLIRQHCIEMNLVPLYHYTDIKAAELIAKAGLMVNGTDGVHFTTFGPTNYHLGSPDYEKNIIKDFYGPDRVDEFINKNRFEVCLVYGMDPLVIEMYVSSNGAKPGHLVHVPKQYFIDLSMEHPSGRYFLHPHRLIGLFQFPSNSSHLNHGLLEKKDDFTMNSMKDVESTTLIQQFITEKETNEELMKSVMKELAPCMKVEWAVTHNASKFKSIFDNTFIPSTHVLLFHYGSLAEISSYVLSGIPVKRKIDNGNLIFTSHLFNELTSYEKELFENCDGFIACSLLRESLVPIVTTDEGLPMDKQSQLYSLPSSLLRAMRGTYFKNMVNPEPWIKGALLLPPTSFKHVFQIIDEDHVTSSKEPPEIEHSLYAMDDVQNTPIPFITKVELISSITSISQYNLKMNNLKMRCEQSGLFPIYYYTSQEEAMSILKYGFKMKNGDIGFLSSFDGGALTSGGVSFNSTEPISFGLFNGKHNYNQNVMASLMNSSSMKEEVTSKVVDVCLVYAINPIVLSDVGSEMVDSSSPSSNNQVIVRKEFFHDFGLPAQDGYYYLRSDYIIGAFSFEEGEEVLKKNNNHDEDSGSIEIEMMTSSSPKGSNRQRMSLKDKKRVSILADKGASRSMLLKASSPSVSSRSSISGFVQDFPTIPIEDDVVIEKLSSIDTGS